MVGGDIQSGQLCFCHEDSLFLAISPVGYPAAKRSLTETMMRSTMKSSSRKEWKKLFYQADSCTPLAKDMAGAYAQPLEMVRLAPSAPNAQLWRVRKTETAYHFYVDYKPGLSKAEKIIKQVELGIALSHFYQTALELELLKRCPRKRQNFLRTYIT